MNKTLSDHLYAWDGVHTAYLSNLYQENVNEPEFFSDVVELCLTIPALQTVTTWLIKHHYDHKNGLPDSLTKRLLSCCTQLEHWEAKLHLLQLLPHFNLEDEAIPPVEAFVRACLADKHKFVRAWAYQGFYELTTYKPELSAELEGLCQKAMETESAAIKSKVRKILKTMVSP